MTQTLPEPLVPADLDLTGHTWFPLHHRKLAQSEWWLGASDLARSRNMDLWIAAYQQIPAASLPDNDVVLANKAGFGRDIAGWKAVKAEIMAPWTLCSDGRWHHETLAGVAREQHELRVADAERKRASRAKKAGSSPPDDGGVSAGRPEDVTRTSDGRSRTSASQRPERKGKENISPQPPLEGGAGHDQSPEGFAEALEAYPLEGRANHGPGPAIAAWPSALSEADGDPAAVVKAIRRYAEQVAAGKVRCMAFHRWLANGGIKAFLDNRGQPAPKWLGPPSVRDKFVEAKGEEWTRTWLDHGGWRDLPRPTVTCRTGVAKSRIEREARSVLIDLGAAVELLEVAA